MIYTDLAVTMLRKDEADLDYIYCDKCGKPWRECMDRREEWLASNDMVSLTWDTPLETLYDDHGICPGGTMSTATGRNVEARKFSDDERALMLSNDLAENEAQVREWLGVNPSRTRDYEYWYFDSLSDTRKAALLDLAHWGNIQSGRQLREYLISAIEHNNSSAGFGYAAREIVWKDGDDSRKGRSGWYEISPTRAQRLADTIETGVMPEFYTEQEK
jgi:hypothetical protein